MTYDVLVVGAGFAGSVMARQYADAGQRVLVIDKRDHIGGNAYDYVNEQGVRVHKYGPHIFHTNSDKVFDYLSRFTEWRAYEHRVLASVDGKLLPMPINLDTVNGLFGLRLDEAGMRAFIAAEVAASWEAGREVRTAEDQCLSTIGRRLYEAFFKGYTTKMWGRDPSELDKSVTARIPLRFDREDRYFTDKHQAMPRDGYTALFERMLYHPLIDVTLGAKGGSGAALPYRTVWTGPVDDYFGQRFGPLPYRSMQFEEGGHYSPAHGRSPGAPTVNWPSETGATRSTDMAWLTDTAKRHFYYLHEYPTAEGEPYYPIPSPEGAALYKRYEKLADATENVTFVGRLATYRYMNMDQVAGQALATFAKLSNAGAQAVKQT